MFTTTKKNPSIHASSSFHCDDNDDDDDFISCQRYTGVCVYKCVRLICLFIQQLFVGVTRIYRYLNGWILDQSIRNFFFVVVVSLRIGFILVFNWMVDWLFVCFIDLFFFAIFLLVVYWCVCVCVFKHLSWWRWRWRWINFRFFSPFKYLFGLDFVVVVVVFCLFCVCFVLFVCLLDQS